MAFLGSDLHTNETTKSSPLVGSFSLIHGFTKIFCFLIAHCIWATIFRRLFSKRCNFGSKSGTKSLVRRYQAKFAKTVAKTEHLKVCQICLIKFKKNG